MSSPFQSIRWRVQLWHGLILLVAIVAFCVTAYRQLWNNQLVTIDRSLFVLEGKLFGALIKASDPARATKLLPGEMPGYSPRRVVEWLSHAGAALPRETADVFEDVGPGHAYFSLREADGHVLLQSAQAPADLIFPPAAPGTYAEEWRLKANRREIARCSPQGLRSLVGRDISPELDQMHRFAWSLSLSGLALWLLGLIGGWWLAGRAIRPITAIGRTAARIADGNLQERISTTRTDSELDQLSRVLNHTFERLHAAFERQKQFTADASHELRTPVTVLLSETERILRRERTPEEYRAAIQTCHAMAERMRHLTEALLLLTRQDARGDRSLHERCDLAAMLRETAKQLGPLVQPRQIQIHLELEPATAVGDPAGLSILATNLLANAIQHHRDGGNVVVRSRCDRTQAIFTVGDDGPGISAEDLPHIFERFYRADRARTSSSGHAGLGLAIAKSIVDNHRGTITATSSPGNGATFEVRLPLWVEAAAPTTVLPV